MNKSENIVCYSEIGEVCYIKNRRAKNLAIRINQKGELRVTVPGYVSMRRAEAFLMARKDWVITKLSQMKHASNRFRIPQDGDLVKVRGKELQIVVQGKEDSAEDALWNLLLVEARAYLPGRVAELAGQHGLDYSGLKIRKMKTRWGSCTAKNSLNLNSWLMMLPDPLSDYVILHELVHTLHRDHSPRFWATLDGLTEGSSKQLRKELKNFRIMFLPAENSL